MDDILLTSKNKGFLPFIYYQVYINIKRLVDLVLYNHHAGRI